ncbi:MAG: phosphotransferase [Bacteroidota bacterium]
MSDFFTTTVLSATRATTLGPQDLIQELWSGYGKILRVQLVGVALKSVVVKHVQLPQQRQHPRGWNTDLGHQRKVKSYRVETAWYQQYSARSKARLPQCLALEQRGQEVIMVLEDLDAAGFSLRKRTVEWEDVARCLAWLAQFHASYLGREPDGLWTEGTYWHLATRPHELATLTDEKLREAAPKIAEQLAQCEHQTLVHGDAKLANFCFAPDGRVAGVDFQYVGGGCGMKDVAYFVGSCLDERDCERWEERILATYFEYLQSALGTKNVALEREWRSLYRVAWADFHRFLKGWSPGHWKLNSYSERVTAEVIQNL